MDASHTYLHLMLLNKDVSNFECFKKTNFVKNQQMLVSMDEKDIRNDVIPLVNVKIHGNFHERSEGMNLLQVILPQCPLDIFADHGFAWMQQCLKWDSRTTIEELKNLYTLIEISAICPDVKKQVICSVLASFSDRLLSHRNDPCQKAIKLKLKCLRNVTNCYSSSCGPYRNDFNKFVLYCLKEYSQSNKIVLQAARCFVSLCQCCSKGQLGVNQKELWSSQLKALVDTSHQLFDSIYSCVDFTGLRPHQESRVAISALLEICEERHVDPVKRFHKWKVTFHVLSQLLRAMLLDEFPVCLSFQPADILALIHRILSVNGNTLKNCTQTTDTVCLNAILPDIHLLALDILEALIRSGQHKSILISYGHSICKLCLQTLKWTRPSEWKYGTSIPFETLRCKTYTLLSVWLAASGSDSLIETVAEDLIPIAISNIEFPKPEIQLSTNPKATKAKKRKLEQNINNANSQLRSRNTTRKLVNEKICAAAHRMLQLLLQHAGNFIKWEYHKTLLYTIVPLLMDIISSNSAADYPVPYSNVECRIELFKTLYALTEWPHFKWKVPLTLTMQILNAGRKNFNPQVSSLCKMIQDHLEPKMHPRGPTFAVQSSDDAEKTANRFASSTCSKLFLDSTISSHSSRLNGDCPVENEQQLTTASRGEMTNLPATNDAYSTNYEESSSNAVTNVGEEATMSVDCTETVDEKMTVDSEISVDVSHPISAPLPEKTNSSPNFSQSEPQSRLLVEENAANKKLKTDVTAVEQIEEDPIVASMLSDFVDTIS